MPPHDPASPRGILQTYRRERMPSEWPGDWAIVVLYRGPAVLVAAVLARLRVAPIAITMVAVLTAVLMPVAAGLAPLHLAGPFLCALGMLYQIIDCSDGMVARATGRTSQFGRAADDIADQTQWGLFYAAFGILADRYAGGGHYFLALGLLAAWARLFAHYINELMAEGPAVKPTGRTFVENVIAFIAGLSGMIPFLALLGDHMAVAVVVILVYGLADVGDAGFRVLKSRLE